MDSEVLLCCTFGGAILQSLLAGEDENLMPQSSARRNG